MSLKLRRRSAAFTLEGLRYQSRDASTVITPLLLRSGFMPEHGDMCHSYRAIGYVRGLLRGV